MLKVNMDSVGEAAIVECEGTITSEVVMKPFSCTMRSRGGQRIV
jgi:hypothetical protein